MGWSSFTGKLALTSEFGHMIFLANHVVCNVGDSTISCTMLGVQGR